MERHYPVEVGNGIEHVKLKKNLVDFLIKLNVERREDRSVDKAFIKGLMIAVFTVQKIKTSNNFNENLKAFINDLFLFRVGVDEHRISSFNRLFHAACSEIRNLKK